MPKNLPMFYAIKRKLTTSSRSLKCKRIEFGTSVCETAWKRKAANMVPSAAPMAIELRKKGIILWMPCMEMVKLTASNPMAIANRMKNGIDG